MKNKDKIVRLVKYDFQGLELIKMGVIKFFKCPKYEPYSDRDLSCKYDNVDKNGYTTCEIKKKILKELGIKEPWSGTRCYLVGGVKKGVVKDEDNSTKGY